MLMLNEQQKDILGEIVNVYIGQAASLLSEMTGQEIQLSVPQVVMLTGDTIDAELFAVSGLLAQGHIISSSIQFSQGLQGKTSLLFPASQAKSLVNACLGEIDQFNTTNTSRDLLDTDFDVLKEVANVILNSIMGGFGELLGTCIEYSVPEIEMLFVADNEQRQFLSKQASILLLKTDFSLTTTSVQGVILIAYSVNSMGQLLEKINSLIKEQSGHAD